MGYITGTMSEANPGAALYDLIAAELVIMGYELVDTVVISANTHKVWKNPAANNPSGKDWFLDVYYPTTGSGQMRFAVMEDFNPSTDQSFRGAGYNSNIDATYKSYFAAAQTLEANSSAMSRPHLTLSSASFGYWISITKKRIAAIGSVDPTIMLYAGLYEPTAEYAAAAGADLFPLIACRLLESTASAGQTTNYIGITRIPPWPTTTNVPFNWVCQPALGGTPSALTGGYVKLPTGDPIMGGGFVASDIEIVMTHVSRPARLGKLYDVAALPADSTVARGDTVTIGGNTWLLGTVSGGVVHAIRQNA